MFWLYTVSDSLTQGGLTPPLSYIYSWSTFQLYQQGVIRQHTAHHFHSTQKLCLADINQCEKAGKHYCLLNEGDSLTRKAR